MNEKLKTIVTNALLIALALGLSFLDSLIILPIPLPGIKLGLANIITLYLLLCSTPINALMVLAARILLASFLYGGVTSLIYSSIGGLLAFLTMWALKRLYPKRLSAAGLSMAGAVMHNTGQICAACLLLGDTAPFSYLPLLILAALITGALMGVLATVIFERVRKSRG